MKFFMEFLQKLDWSDLIFVACGYPLGIVTILIYDYYDPIADWEQFKLSLILMWLLISAGWAYIAVEVKVYRG